MHVINIVPKDVEEFIFYQTEPHKNIGTRQFSRAGASLGNSMQMYKMVYIDLKRLNIRKTPTDKTESLL